MENPFRPGGELAQEADEIVNLIKQGKPITPNSSPICDDLHKNKLENSNEKNEKKKKSNSDGEIVEINNSVLDSKIASFPEHVVIPEEEFKKKSKCCVIQ